MKKLFIIPVAVLLACNQGKQQQPAVQTADSAAKGAGIQVADSLVANTRVDSSGKVITIPANQLIVPGKSIGLTKIGQDAEQTAALLGKPDAGDAAMGKSLNTWYSKKEPQYKTQVFSSIHFGADEDKPRVRSIRINNPFFETATGLKAGSSWINIKKEFPGLLLLGSYKSAAGKVKVFDDITKGIAFEINEQDTCVGICVHTKEEKGFLQYLPFEASFTAIEN